MEHISNIKNNNNDNYKDEAKQYYKDNIDKIKQYYKKYYENNKDPDIPRKGSKEHRIKVSCKHQNINRDEWSGFLKDQLYCSNFNDSCKEQNRDKYDRKCFICGKSELENGKKLSVHHVDRNKNQGCNDVKWSLIPLCISCHSSSHREPLQSRIQYLVK